MRIAVFASGRGSNLQAIHDAVLADKLHGVSLDLLVCDHPDAPVVKEVKKRGIPAFVFRPQDYPDKNSYFTFFLPHNHFLFFSNIFFFGTFLIMQIKIFF